MPPSRRGLTYIFIALGVIVIVALLYRTLPGGSSATADAGLAIRLGIASYTFRNFSRAEMIGFLKQAHVSDMNSKDTKDHLPADAVEEIKALGDYVSAGIKLHAAGTIYFPKDEDADIRAKFEYAKRAGIGVIVAGDPASRSSARVNTPVSVRNSNSNILMV